MKTVRKVSEKNLVLLLSFIVGVSSGLAAVLLKKSIGLLQRTFGPALHSSSSSESLWLLVLPGIGMLISLVFVRYIIRDDIGHGVTRVLHSISHNESRIKPHNMFSSIVSSAVTIGFGGSVGAEAPIVYTGAAIGSNVGKRFGLSWRNVTVLVGCGAAGAVAGIFKAPLAAVLFVFEILLFNISMNSMTPLLISSLSATVVAYLFQGSTAQFVCHIEPFEMHNIPFYIILGLVCGGASLYFTRMTLSLEDRLSKLDRPWLKWVLCSVGLGLLIFLMPPLYGEGYDSVVNLLNVEDAGGETMGRLFSILPFGMWSVPVCFALFFFLKVIAMTLTNAGGGVGGTFGPTLVAGAIAGFVVSRSINLMLVSNPFCLPEHNFVLVGMAALMAGVMQAPMTAIFLIAEITGGYELFLPLIVASTVSYGFTRIWERYSIYTKRLAQSGELLTHDNDQAALALMKTSDLVRDKYPRMSVGDSLADIVSTIAESTAQVFAVVDSEGKFEGLVDVGAVRPYLVRKEEYDRMFVYNFMEQPPALIYIDEKMDSVMRKFDRTGAWRLPVVSRDMTYLGFISNSRLLMAYREELKDISQD